MVTTRERLVGALISSTGTASGRSSKGSVVGVTDRSSSSRNSCDFRVAKGWVQAAALPEPAIGASSSVAVGGTGSVLLLRLVVAGQGELDQGGNEE